MQWVDAGPLDQITKTPVRLTVEDHPLVAWRGAHGHVAVLVDRCPHRGLPLSLGHRAFGGHLVCAGHDWVFDDAGRCVHTPDDRDLTRCAATEVPHRDQDGRLFVAAVWDDEQSNPS